MQYIRAREGILSGDISVGFAGELVGTVDELHRLLTEERVGRPAPLTLLRRTEKRELPVTPREAPPRGTDGRGR